MAQWDDAENYDTPYPNGTGAAANGPGTPVYDRVAQLYLNALGRPGSDAEIHQWADGKTVNDLATIQQQIYATPEADAFSRSQQQQAPQQQNPVNPNPTTPVTTPAGQPAAAVGGGPAPSAPTQAAPGGAPTYTAPTPLQAPPAFSYDAFKPPTQQDVLNDPSYQLTRDQGLQAIGHKNAALGTLNTGGTIGDFIGFAGNLANAKYGDIYNRDFNTYGANRANAFDTYKTNYGISKDVYDTNYKDQYQDPFANNFAVAGQNQNNNQFNASLGQNNNQFNTNLGFNSWLQNYKMQVSDPFDMKYKLLGLL